MVEWLKRRVYVDVLASSALPRLFVEWWRVMFDHNLFHQSQLARMRNVRQLLAVVVNCAKVYSPYRNPWPRRHTSLPPSC